MIFPSSIYEHPFYTVFFTIITAILGGCMASFVACMAGRLKKRESLGGRSHCDSCGHVLGAKDLVPILSWVSTRGRCRYCRAKIPLTCPMSEMALAIIYVVALFSLDFSWALVKVLLLSTLVEFIILMVQEANWEDGRE